MRGEFKKALTQPLPKRERSHIRKAIKKNYKNMIEKMEAKPETWYVYILECADESFYTGIAKDLNARIKKHHLGTAAKYTRTRLPIQLVYHETCKSRSEALKRECKIKSYSKIDKKDLILGFSG